MESKTIYNKFKTQEDCIKYLEIILWNGIPVCPYCSSKKQTPMPREQRYHCNICHSSYSVTVSTPFHKTKVELQKWFIAIPEVINNKISVRSLATSIGVAKDTAAFMKNRIILANKSLPNLINHFLNH